MLHHRLQDLEAEIAAKEQCQRKLDSFPPEAIGIFDYIERDIELRLADKVPKDWKGWISYRRLGNHAMIILRGRSFKDGMFGDYRAGFDVPQGHDAITEFQRRFDISPPAELDHLLINFGLDGDNVRIFLWYGENIAPYKLIYAADLHDEPHEELSAAVLEACIWIVKRPKHQTLSEFLKLEDELERKIKQKDE